jgi:orotate phosphoribosyltransferase
MEKGMGNKSTLHELQENLGIRTYAIVTIDEIISYLYNREIDGRILLNDELKQKVDQYRREYGVE